MNMSLDMKSIRHTNHIEMLYDWLPEQAEIEMSDCQAVKMAENDAVVVRKMVAEQMTFPGKHKNVWKWCIVIYKSKLYAVGWNESPSRGWSYPVVKIDSETAQKAGVTLNPPSINLIGLRPKGPIERKKTGYWPDGE